MSRVLGRPGLRRGVAARLLLASLGLSAALCLGPADRGSAQSSITLPANDLNQLLPATGFPTPTPAPLQHNAEPALQSVPRAACDAASRPLGGTQGRVPASAINSAAAAQGWTCNVTVLGHHATPGGFRVWRYVDRQGQECAFYDTSLASPLNLVSVAGGPSPGVVVLDMSDPAHPVQTDQLTSLPMLAPHEALNLNARRGLLAAELGNGTTLPGLMAIYDVGADCRHPVLDATFLASRFGHESGFAPDGNIFWIAGGEGIAAVDVRDPRNPRTIWEGNVYAHGLNLSDDGNRLYDADPINGNLVILDVSQVQANPAEGSPFPSVSEISRLTWGPVSVPQNTAPMKIDGHAYLLEFDEFAFRFSVIPPTGVPGAARVIDISDEAHPRVVSNIRLAVNQPAQRAAASGDPAPLPSPYFGYAAHYCAIPREVDPEIVACSFINSGLRVFNIEDPLHPREVAYYVAPPKAGSNGGTPGDLALSQPAFVPARREVWYTDAGSGFYALRLSQSAWPQGASSTTGTSPTPSVTTRRAPTPRASGAAAAAPVGTQGSAGASTGANLPFTGLDLRLPFAAGLALILAGVALGRLARPPGG